MLALPIAAVTGDAAGVLTDLFLVLVAAKLGDEVFKRIGQPAIVGEILGGVLIGPRCWAGSRSARCCARREHRDERLPRRRPGGDQRGNHLGHFLDLGLIRRPGARTVLGAAVADDILALILLSVAVRMAADGGVDAAKIALALGVAVAFVAFVALGGTRLLQGRPRLLEAPRFADSPLLPAVILCLGLAAFAAQIGLAALIGAFLAGMIVAETKDHTSIEEEVKPLYAFFPPFLRLHRHRAEPWLVAQRRHAAVARRRNRAGRGHQVGPGLPGGATVGPRRSLDRRHRHDSARRGGHKSSPRSARPRESSTGSSSASSWECRSSRRCWHRSRCAS